MSYAGAPMYMAASDDAREVEEKILKHPGVGECAVLGLPDPRWGEVGVAVCVPAAGQRVDEAELRAFLEPLMARYKMPKTFVFWDEMPKSGYGKIVKRTIREALLAQDGTQNEAP